MRLSDFYVAKKRLFIKIDPLERTFVMIFIECRHQQMILWEGYYVYRQKLNFDGLLLHTTLEGLKIL